MTLQLNMKLMEFIIKSSKGEKLNPNELQELIDLKKQFSEHMASRTLDNKKDKELFPQ